MNELSKLKQQLLSIPGIDSPVVYGGFILAVLILLWSFAIAPYFAWRDGIQQQISVQQEKAKRLLALESSSDEWRDSAANYQSATEELSAAIFQQSSYVTAQTELLNFLREMIKKHNLTLDSQGLMESEAEPGIGQRIGINLRTHGKAANILQFFDELSGHPKLLRFEKIYLAKTAPGEMTLTIQVSGFRLAERETG